MTKRVSHDKVLAYKKKISIISVEPKNGLLFDTVFCVVAKTTTLKDNINLNWNHG